MRVLILTLTAILIASGHAQAKARMIYDGSQPERASIFQLQQTSQKDAPSLTALLKRHGERTCGQVRIVRQFKGFFLLSKAETLYLFINCGEISFAADPQRRPAGDLAVVSQGKLLYHKIEYADSLSILPDLNGDGKLEFLAHQWFGPHMGEFARYSSLESFRTLRLRTIMRLGATYLETEKFDSNGNLKQSTVSVLTLWFNPQKPNEVNFKRYSSPACVCHTPEAPYNPKQAKLTADLTVDLRQAPQDLPDDLP